MERDGDIDWSERKWEDLERFWLKLNTIANTRGFDGVSLGGGS